MVNVVGGLELGGTKSLCAVGAGPGEIRVELSLPTTSPDETIGRLIEFFRAHGPLTALGIASFGPLDLEPRSPTFGSILTTPKPGWSGTDLAFRLRRGLDAPVVIDTDVNGAALGEHRWGAARDVSTFVYVTVGTGVGGGGLIDGRPMRGLVHPEMGHMRVPHDHAADPFPGVCPFHGDCLEGLASGPAIAERWRAAPETIPADHPAWEMEAHYLALGLVNVIATVAPQRIVIGGGVLRQAPLLPLVRTKVVEQLAGYTPSAALGDVTRYIVAPALGDRAGVLGAMALALDHARGGQERPR
jgi:fructokinase